MNNRLARKNKEIWERFQEKIAEANREFEQEKQRLMKEIEPLMSMTGQVTRVADLFKQVSAAAHKHYQVQKQALDEINEYIEALGKSTKKK